LVYHTMSEGDFSSGEKERAIQALRAIGLAQQNASLLLKELRMKCKQYCLDGEFLTVQAAFTEAERVAAQELRALLAMNKPLPTPEKAMEAYREEAAAGSHAEASETLEEARRAWSPSRTLDGRMLAAGERPE
jgi:hypothetical protein